MPQSDRQIRLMHLFNLGQCHTREWLMTEFGVSRATLNRDLEVLRDRLNAPIVYDRDRGGYRLDRQATVVGTQYELPGMWLSAQEIHALLTMQHLLSELDAGGLLSGHIQPLIQRLADMLDEGTHAAPELARRVRVQTVGARRMALPHFQAVGSALLRRQRLQITYHARSRDETTEREVSPQRLVHHRGNWYLDAWCHLRRGLRAFSVDAITRVSVIDRTALDVAESELDASLGAGYGIFTGKKTDTAVLRFSAERARWVSVEQWHPSQHGAFDEQGRYVLRVPYADPTELVMDILRHLPEVEVLAPPALHQAVAQRLAAAAANFPWPSSSPTRESGLTALQQALPESPMPS